MAFAVICKSCQARFLLNDDLLRRKVAGRVVTVRCRQCHAPIEVDASALEPQKAVAAPKPVPVATPTPTPVKVGLAQKAAPVPPRPAKSATLMGIGGPPRPAAPPEMVALSPGLLEVRTPAGARGFPEPPPPPTSVEELADDWDPEPATPRRLPIPDAPESVDDFIEELPPSLPPPVDEDDELPTSIGTPALSALVHHGAMAPKPKADDFFANVGAPSPLEAGAPTIDVSTLGSVGPQPTGPSIDVSSLEAPRAGKQTLPLFGLSDLDIATPPLPVSAVPKPLAEPPVPSERPESTRTRRNVVAPPTSSVPPPAPASRRSALAIPVLLVLAAAAGVLIWKRSGTVADRVEMVEAPRAAVTTPPASAPPEATPEPTPVSAATTTIPAEDDVTFETKPTRSPTGKSDKPAVATREPATPSQALPAPAALAPKSEPVVEPALPAPKTEPKPAEPSEPAGPFDREAAAAALNAAASTASACRKEGDPSGTASVVITFAPSGRVTSANIGGPPFAGTPTGGCIAATLRKARIPAFEGDRVTVSKTIVVQ